VNEHLPLLPFANAHMASGAVWAQDAFRVLITLQEICR
jgi:hypothetical protein